MEGSTAKRENQKKNEKDGETVILYLSLDEVDGVIQDEAMWRDFVDVSDKLGDELPVST